MDAEKKRLRDEVAELAEAVRTLRDELVITRAAYRCDGCHCVHLAWTYPLPGCAPYPPIQVWSGTVISGGYTVTNSLSQGN